MIVMNFIKALPWNEILKWGLGGVLMISSLIFMICSASKVIDVDWPEYVIVGSIGLATGVYVWTFETIYNKKNLKKKVDKEEDK